MAAPSHKRNRLLPLIGVFKLFKALVLFGAAYAMRHLRHASDVEQTLARWTRTLHADPDAEYLHRLLAKVTGVSPHKLHVLGIGLFTYAALFCLEGVGLIMGKRWGEYVTVVITSLLVPLEVYELIHPGRRLVKVGVLVFNLAIIAYLIWNLIRTRHDHDDAPAPSGPVASAPSSSA